MKKVLFCLLFLIFFSRTNATPKYIDIISKGIKANGKDIYTKQTQKIIGEKPAK